MSVIRVIIFIVIIVAALYMAAYIWFYWFALLRRRKGEAGADVNPRGQWVRYGDEIREGVNWFLSQKPERVSIVSRDGLRLAADYLPAPGSSRTVMLMHGYRSNVYSDFGCEYRVLFETLGCSLLVVHQRSHGDSEGRYITYGAKERYDCLLWTRYLLLREPVSDIFLYGLSMGAATVLMASGLELPENVRGIIADCGFTSAFDIFTYIVGKKLRLPAKTFVSIAEAFTWWPAGFKLREASATNALKSCRLPVLFLHGADDGFVPPHMSEENFKSCAAEEKEIIIVEGAEHGVSFMADRSRCEDAIGGFIMRNSADSEDSAEKREKEST